MDNGLTYIRVGDYYIPNLALDPELAQPIRDIGKYGRMRLTYLKQHRRKLYQELVSTGKLQAYLLDINDTANDWLDRMMPGMAKEAGATEELKSRDPMRWVGLMNCCKAQVEEIIFSELIYIIPNSPNTIQRAQIVALCFLQSSLHLKLPS